MNVRELCRLLSATLHLPGVDRWAEQLVDRELLPGLDHKGAALDAALLLAAVVAAPRPEDAPLVVVTLANLPLISTRRWVGSAEIETWARGTDADIAALPSDPLEALATAIEQEPFPENRFYFGSLKIEENGASAELLGCRASKLSRSSAPAPGRMTSKAAVRKTAAQMAFGMCGTWPSDACVPQPRQPTRGEQARQGGHARYRGPAEAATGGPLMAETPSLVPPYQTAISASGKPQKPGAFLGHSARSRVEG